MKKVVKTASVMILNNHKILLLLRDDRPDLVNPNTWCLIGGYVENKESEKAAAHREAKEETGLSLDRLDYIGTHEYTKGYTTATFLSVVSDLLAKEAKLGDEGQEIRFFSFDELSKVPLSGSIRKYYNDYQEELKSLMETEEPKRF
ncbi:NUDIX domain-containing protein [Candidatus Saccharibacteria bacterium]|nr:NUDIX domain-containing protein [Candidatus Saccharibacteria bacterium]